MEQKIKNLAFKLYEQRGGIMHADNALGDWLTAESLVKFYHLDGTSEELASFVMSYAPQKADLIYWQERAKRVLNIVIAQMQYIKKTKAIEPKYPISVFSITDFAELDNMLDFCDSLVSCNDEESIALRRLLASYIGTLLVVDEDTPRYAGFKSLPDYREAKRVHGFYLQNMMTALDKVLEMCVLIDEAKAEKEVIDQKKAANLVQIGDSNAARHAKKQRTQKAETSTKLARARKTKIA